LRGSDGAAVEVMRGTLAKPSRRCIARCGAFNGFLPLHPF
jgi:hypothetical protein